MKIDLENAKKNVVLNTFKKVVDTTGNRPVLSCINFDKDGSMVATNSHVLLKIEGTHQPTERDLLFNPVQGVPMEGVNYPNVDRIIPDNSTNTVTISSDSFPALVVWLKALGKKELVNISASDKNELVFTSDSNPAINYSVDYDSNYTGKLDTLNISVNASYLLTGLQLYKDVNADCVTFGFSGNVRPLTMVCDQFTYLIAPIRKY